MLRRVSGMLNRSMLRLAHQQTFNNSYVTEMYKAWQTDKNSVSEQWS
jgi:2-oxoglutarate dehydrogenase complex dehydrogenase (E1) component-like enzyme